MADADGNAIVAGVTDDRATGRDILIIKYSGAGVALWTNRYDGPGHGDDIASAIATDGIGNIFVTGSSTGSGGNWDYATIAYSGAGVALWTNYYNGPGNSDDAAHAMAMDDNGNLFVTGYSTGSGGDWDYTTIAYSEAGVALWTNRYSGPANGHDRANAVATDGDGNLFVTGYSTGSGGYWDYATIAYSGAGLALWTNCFNGQLNHVDSAYAIAVDNNGHVFVTGSSIGSEGNWGYATIAYSVAGVAIWTNRHQGPIHGNSEATAMAVDASGNVFVTGASFNKEGIYDYVTIAYSGAGVGLWTNRYDGPGSGQDGAKALVVDNSGNVYVTGYSTDVKGNYDYATIAYSGAGVALWTNYYDYGGPGALALAVDNIGTVFVTGSAFGSGTASEASFDFATIAYAGSGLALWTNRYNGTANTDDRAWALALDGSGNVFVTGTSYSSETDYDYATIAYSSDGVALWTNRYNGPGNMDDQARAVAADGNGNVFVTGYSFGAGSDYDYVTIAYSASGVALWTNCYSGPDFFDDYANALAVDNSGNVFVTGHSGPVPFGGSLDYTTIAYSGAGVPLWTNRYDGPGNDRDSAVALAVDNHGNVFVTGYSTGSGGGWDYATIAYSGAGMALWTNRYDGPDNAIANAVAVDDSGSVYVTGYSGFSFSGLGKADYATIAYSGVGVPLWTNCYDGPSNSDDAATAVAADGGGHVFVTGSSIGAGSRYEYATIAYSGAGVALWTNRFGRGNLYDYATAVAVDKNGNVFVKGTSRGIGGGDDYATIAYSGAGVALWTNFYNGPANGRDWPGGKSCLAIGPDGAVYVTGSSDGNYGDDERFDFATVKYVWRPQLAIQPLTPVSTTVNLKLSGPASSTWSIERAVTLSGPWTNLGPSLIGTNGLGTFQDANPPAQGAFYRATQP